MEAKWKTGENLCMLSAMYKVLDKEQRDLATVRFECDIMLLAKLRNKTRKSEGSTEENHSGEVNFTRQESRMKEWCKGT